MPWLLRFLSTPWDSWMLEGISVVFHKNLQYSVQSIQSFLYDMQVKVKVNTWHAYEGTAGIGGIALTHLQPSCWKEWVVSAILWPFYPWERAGTHCIVGGRVQLLCLPHIIKFTNVNKKMFSFPTLPNMSPVHLTTLWPHCGSPLYLQCQTVLQSAT